MVLRVVTKRPDKSAAVDKYAYSALEISELRLRDTDDASVKEVYSWRNSAVLAKLRTTTILNEQNNPWTVYEVDPDSVNQRLWATLTGVEGDRSAVMHPPTYWDDIHKTSDCNAVFNGLKTELFSDLLRNFLLMGLKKMAI